MLLAGGADVLQARGAARLVTDGKNRSAAAATVVPRISRAVAAWVGGRRSPTRLLQHPHPLTAPGVPHLEPSISARCSAASVVAGRVPACVVDVQPIKIGEHDDESFQGAERAVDVTVEFVEPECAFPGAGGSVPGPACCCVSGIIASSASGSCRAKDATAVSSGERAGCRSVVGLLFVWSARSVA